MPHTSKKKKAAPNKRRQIVGEDGWTRITTIKQQPLSTDATYHSLLESDEQMRAQGFEPYITQSVTGEDVVSWPVTPRRAAEAMTDAKLFEHYKDIERRWSESLSCNILKGTLRIRTLCKLMKITSCVCLGTGTPSGIRDGWIGRHEVALYQLAAFKTVVDMIEQVTGVRPPAFAQEPDYNDYDERLLKRLLITKVNHPAAFCLITNQSFVFCPGAEPFIELRVLRSNPSIHLGTNLHFYRETLVSMPKTLPKPSTIGEDGPRVPLKDPRMYLQDEDIITIYQADKAVVKLPSLDVQDHPFHDMHLYWRLPGAPAVLHSIW